jgi:hypothetical protein
MTKDDVTPADGDDEGPITPEVVRRGAAGRKRRVIPGTEPDGPAPDDGPAPIPGRLGRGVPTGRIFHMAAMLLVGVGVLELVLAVPAVYDPAAARCASARNAIEVANDNDDSFDDVDLPEAAEDADDVECDEALALAGRIPDDEDDEPAADAEYGVTESAIVVQSSIFAVHGVISGIVGFLLRRRPTRMLRNGALALVAIAVLPLTQLGIIGLALIVFLVYGLGFSADAKALFPRHPDAPSLFRPRPPAAS